MIAAQELNNMQNGSTIPILEMLENDIMSSLFHMLDIINIFENDIISDKKNLSFIYGQIIETIQILLDINKKENDKSVLKIIENNDIVNKDIEEIISEVDQLEENKNIEDKKIFENINIEEESYHNIKKFFESLSDDRILKKENDLIQKNFFSKCINSIIFGGSSIFFISILLFYFRNKLLK